MRHLPYRWRMPSVSSHGKRFVGFPVALAAFVAAIGSFAVSYVIFDARGLTDNWQCGASDCDTVAMGAVMVALAFGAAGLLAGGFFTAWRAETLSEVAIRCAVWLVLSAVAAFLVATIWQLPPGHPAA
jgi:hypothetical protein